MALACIAAGAILLGRALGTAVKRPALTVRAVAHQWWWEFDYPSLGIRTSDVLYLPSATDVRLELSSADVLHSFWITGMNSSVSVAPGKTRPLDLLVKSPGELFGNCDSGCGCAKVCMRFRVLASSPGAFDRWAARERSIPAEFKPPNGRETPACALNSGHDGHGGRDSAAARLRSVLNGGEPSAQTPSR